jgi:hypothetical protein
MTNNLCSIKKVNWVERFIYCYSSTYGNNSLSDEFIQIMFLNLPNNFYNLTGLNLNNKIFGIGGRFLHCSFSEVDIPLHDNYLEELGVLTTRLSLNSYYIPVTIKWRPNIPPYMDGYLRDHTDFSIEKAEMWFEFDEETILKIKKEYNYLRSNTLDYYKPKVKFEIENGNLNIVMNIEIEFINSENAFNIINNSISESISKWNEKNNKNDVIHDFKIELEGPNKIRMLIDWGSSGNKAFYDFLKLLDSTGLILKMRIF